MWERFSYCGMQAILLCCLHFSVAAGGLGIDQATAAGVTVGLVCVAPNPLAGPAKARAARARRTSSRSC